jgi:hypothetical protein
MAFKPLKRSLSTFGNGIFMITGGQHPFKGIFTERETVNQSVEDYIKQFKEMWKQAKNNLEKVAEPMMDPLSPLVIVTTDD